MKNPCKDCDWHLYLVEHGDCPRGQEAGKGDPRCRECKPRIDYWQNLHCEGYNNDVDIFDIHEIKATLRKYSNFQELTESQVLEEFGSYMDVTYA